MFSHCCIHHRRCQVTICCTKIYGVYSDIHQWLNNGLIGVEGQRVLIDVKVTEPFCQFPDCDWWWGFEILRLTPHKISRQQKQGVQITCESLKIRSIVLK